MAYGLHQCTIAHSAKKFIELSHGTLFSYDHALMLLLMYIGYVEPVCCEVLIPLILLLRSSVRKVIMESLGLTLLEASSFALAASVQECNADNCARAVTGTYQTMQSAHLQDCSSFFTATV